MNQSGESPLSMIQFASNYIWERSKLELDGIRRDIDVNWIKLLRLREENTKSKHTSFSHPQHSRKPCADQATWGNQEAFPSQTNDFCVTQNMKDDRTNNRKENTCEQKVLSRFRIITLAFTPERNVWHIFEDRLQSCGTGKINIKSFEFRKLQSKWDVPV
jgi:hypothetical protein